MTVAASVSSVIASLENEEVTSVGFLVGVQNSADLDATTANVSDRVADLEAKLGDGLPARVRAAIEAQAALSPVRQGISSRTQTPDQVVAAFNTTIDSIVASLSLATDADTSTATGREVLALDTLLRIDALHAAGAANLLTAVARQTESAIIDYAATQHAAGVLEGELSAYASPAQIDLYALVAGAYVQRLGDSFVSAFASSPRTTVANMSAGVLYPQLMSYLQLGGLVEAKIVADVTAAATREQRTNRIDAYAVAAGALLILLLVILLSWLGVRSVSRSLAGVASAAGQAADRAEVELRRVADDHVEAIEYLSLDALPVAARTEVGDFARVFVRAQRAAATIVERQAAGRRNLAQMTGTAGRRGAQLVARQLAIIGRLERTETDPQILDELYRLDHVTDRLRRVTASLVTLAEPGENGRHAADESGYVAAMTLADVVRLALDEVETETRVDVSVPAGSMVEPPVIDDVVLLFAELIANATAFSRTATRVRVFARPYDSGVSIVDAGIGMSDEQLGTANARLAHAERLDLASSGALGLFVVGRLARRHDLRVTFEHTPGGGVTAIVDLGHHVTTTAPAETARATAPVVATASIPRPRHGDAETPVAAASGPSLWEPMRQLDSRPFNLERFERASEILGAGRTWNAFEVIPPPFAELPAGPNQPALPGRLNTAYADADHPPVAGDFHGDLPRAGSGFTGASLNPAGTSSAYSGGDDVPRTSGPLAQSGDDLAGAGGAIAGPRRPFAGMAHPLAGAGRPVAGRGPFDGLAFHAAPDDGGQPNDGGQSYDGGPFDGDGGVFPAGGVARYVPPDEPDDAADPAFGAHSTDPTTDTHSTDPTTDTRSTDPATDTRSTSPAAGARSANPAGRPLSRRVPGASSPTHSLDLVSRFRTLDPDEARSLVEQFEIGVARALGETAADRVDDEGHSR
jgi:signal transduction histidine kinase